MALEGNTRSLDKLLAHIDGIDNIRRPYRRDPPLTSYPLSSQECVQGLAGHHDGRRIFVMASDCCDQPEEAFYGFFECDVV